MKTTYYTSLTATLLITSGSFFSQTNAYFLNDPVWRLSSACVLPPHDQCVRNENYNYYTQGDTTLNSLVYKKMYKKGQGAYGPKMGGSSVNCPGPYHYTDNSPSYFLRSAGKQIFVRNAGDPNESLLYDFNLQVGDTLPITYNNWLTDITVTAIDSISIPPGYRKKFTLSNNTHAEYLIEGIGHAKGLLEPMGPIFDCGYQLDCYSIHDTAYFPAAGPTCEIPVGIRSYDKAVLVSVFPNPFSARAVIHADVALHNAQLNIYNQYGQSVRIITAVSGETVEIARESLSSGIYFFEIILPDRSPIIGKLVIAD